MKSVHCKEKRVVSPDLECLEKVKITISYLTTYKILFSSLLSLMKWQLKCSMQEYSCRVWKRFFDNRNSLQPFPIP